MNAEFQALRDRLVLAALPHVVFDGWSKATLEQAARDEELDPTWGERAFLGGPVEAVEHFSDMADRLMAHEMAAMALDEMRVSQRIELAIKIRLSRWQEHREAIRRGLSMLVLPQHAGDAARVTLATVDAMWHAAGDSSHDFSWYTRRATLAAVYSATLLYWLDDESEGCVETWAFVQRRLSDVGRLAKAGNRVKDWLAHLPLPGALRRSA